MRDCLAWCGARPVANLLDIAPVGPRWCLVHATHMDDGGDGSARAQRRGRGPVPDHRGQSRRRPVPARRLSSPPAAASASAPTATSRSARSRSCAGSSTASAWRSAAPAGRRERGRSRTAAPGCGGRRWPAAPRRSAAGSASLAPGYRADLVRLDADAPAARRPPRRQPARQPGVRRQRQPGARRHGRRPLAGPGRPPSQARRGRRRVLAPRCGGWPDRIWGRQGHMESAIRRGPGWRHSR